MQLAVRLPTDLLRLSDRATKGRAAKRAWHEALDKELVPVTPDASARTTTIYLSDDEKSKLLGHGVAIKDFSRAIASLIYAWALRERRGRQQVKAVAVHYGDVKARQLRPLQRKAIEQVAPYLASGRIVFQEASTGVGKSRVLATLAHMRRQEGQKVTIATPSVGLMAQLIEEFLALGLPAPAPYLGRGQFVDPERLQAILNDSETEISEEDRIRARAWTGTPVPGSGTDRLTRHMPHLAWLVADLVELAPTVPINVVRLARGVKEHAAYDETRAQWEAAPVRLTTHAFVAVDMLLQRYGRTLVPEYGCLLIDEAHTLEDTVSHTFGVTTSLFSLRVWLRQTIKERRRELTKQRLLAATKRVLQATEDAMGALGRNPPGTTILPPEDEPDDAATNSAELRGVCLTFARAVRNDLVCLVGSSLPDASRLEDVQRMCADLTDGATAAVTISPVRRFGSIATGPRGLHKAFMGLWARVDCAAMLSGTLMADTAESGITGAYFANKLHVEDARLAECPRVVAPWLHKLPTVYVPAASDVKRLEPPHHEEDAEEHEEGTEAEQSYYTELARAILLATDDAAGGTLVLCTSYRAIGLLVPRLNDLGSRLMQQTRGGPFGGCVRAFCAESKDGHRPVWLATGQAWTGLDLRDTEVAPEEDALLTDVIVTRLPVRTGDTVQDRVRKPRYVYSDMRISTSFRFRQGIGRLMRADGQRGRRLWVLDGRLWSTSGSNPYLCGPSLRALNPYRHVETFAVGEARARVKAA